MNKKLIVSLVVAGFSLSLILIYIFLGQYFTRLSRVDNIQFENNYLSWDKVNNSSRFNIVINGVSFETYENYIEYQTEQALILFEIQAVSSFNRLLNSRWRRVEFNKLPYVERIWINDGILRWDKVEKADSYYLLINEELTNVNDNYYRLNSGEEINVRIRPTRNNIGNIKFFSNFSDIFEARILEAPEVSFDQIQTRINWPAINNSTGYQVRIFLDKEMILEKQVIETFFTYDFLEAGKYYIYVQALAEGDTKFFSSAFSKQVTVTRLAAPTLLRLIEENNSELRFLIESLDTESFKIIIDEYQFESTNEFLFNNSEITNIQIEIFSLSNDPNSLNSLTSTIFAFQRNDSPSELRIENDILYWQSSAEFFMIKNGNEIFFTDNLFFSLRNALVMSSEISVKALSNGNNTLSSLFSETLTFIKLSAPENLFINNFLLSWKSEAENFIILINEIEVRVNSNMYLIREKDLRSVMDIRVIALGNGTTIVSSSESKTWRAYQLNTPVLKNNNDKLYWEEDTNRLYTHIVHNDNSTNISEAYWSFSNVEAGSHQFRIMFLGDNSRYFDSGISDTLSIEKLPTPIIASESDRFTWTTNNNGFELSVNGDNRFLTDNFYQPNFRRSGTHQIGVRALGNNNNIVSSTQAIITHEVEQLELRIDNFLIFTRNGINLLININRPVANAISYELFVNGNRVASFAFAHVIPVYSGQQFQISFRAIGDGMHFADSEVSVIQNVQILEETKDITLHFIAEDFFHLRFESVRAASGYEIVVIKYDAQNRLISDNSNNPVIQGDTLLAIDMTNVSRLVIRIKARSNQAGLYDSNFYTREFIL